MKFLTIAFISLLSSATFASGFVCQGQGYRVKLYNEVQPSLGTKNPAVLVVATERGTLARLQGSEIEESISSDAITYEGLNNAVTNGHFIKVRLSVAKQAETTGAYEGMHFARLLVDADNGRWTADLACSAYLKGQN